MIQKILKLFANTLPVDEKHYLLNRENLARSIQMQLYQKQKIFSQLSFALLKSLLNYKHLPKKGDRHSSYISRNAGSKKLG